jgi:hypothetical protein
MNRKYTVDDCKIVDLETKHNELGNITIVKNNLTIPFAVKRIYYLYDIPMGTERGGHAHLNLEQYVIAGSGSFTFIVDDGKNRKEFFLNRPNLALHILPGIWRDMRDFSSGSVCLVLASMAFQEEDYVRDFNNFLKYRNE